MFPDVADPSPSVRLIQFTDEEKPSLRPVLRTGGFQPGQRIYVNIGTTKAPIWVRGTIVYERLEHLTRVQKD